VLGNLSTHKGERMRELIEQKGCELLYLQPYSPVFNPIEEAFAKNEGVAQEIPAVHPRDLGGSDGKDARCRNGSGTLMAWSSIAATE
jgi:hypothetical protein